MVIEGQNFFRTCCKPSLTSTSSGWCVSRLPWSTRAEHNITVCTDRARLNRAPAEGSFILSFCYCPFKHILSRPLENLLEKPYSLGDNTQNFFKSPDQFNIRASTSHPIEDSHRPAWTCYSWNLEEWGACVVNFITMFSLLLYSLVSVWTTVPTPRSDRVEMGGERKAKEVFLDLQDGGRFQMPVFLLSGTHVCPLTCSSLDVGNTPSTGCL